MKRSVGLVKANLHCLAQLMTLRTTHQVVEDRIRCYAGKEKYRVEEQIRRTCGRVFYESKGYREADSDLFWGE